MNDLDRQRQRTQEPTTTRRQELIADLLRLSADPLSVAAAWEGVKGTGTAVPIRPHEPRCSLLTGKTGARCTCWIRSLDELQRCLTTLKKTDRPSWYAVVHRYRLCTRQPKLVHVKNGRPQLEPNQQAIGLINRTDLNRHGTGQTRVLIETWRPGLNPAYTQRGIEQLAALFQGAPELPLDLLNAA